MTDQELIEYCNKNLIYNPVTGVFTWIKSRGTQKAGSIGGTISKSDGAIRIKVNKKVILAHRLGWFLTYKYWPKTLDHINHDRTDNRIANLRECSQSQNSCNRPAPINNISGYKGVSLRGNGKWRAKIHKNGKAINLGTYICRHEAARVYNLAARMYHGEYAYTNTINI